MQNKIEIYQTEDKETRVEVRLDDDTVWLNQYQMSDLFKTDRTSVQKHLKNIFSTGELSENATCAKFAQVQKEGSRTVKRNIKYYNLDVIISVGYRVNSLRGTQFRIWANKILKEYLVKGYSLNKRMLEKEQEKVKSLRDAVKLITSLSLTADISNDEKDNFLWFLERYSSALLLLDDYDYSRK